MAIDYTLKTKAELIGMLQMRDADMTDLEVLKIKIEKLTEKKIRLTHRANEVLKIGALSSEEKNLVSAALQDMASKAQDKITELTALQTKLTTL